MPFWILFLMIPLGEDFAYKGITMEITDTYRECLQAMDTAEQDNPEEYFVCAEVE